MDERERIDSRLLSVLTFFSVLRVPNIQYFVFFVDKIRYNVRFSSYFKNRASVQEYLIPLDNFGPKNNIYANSYGNTYILTLSA